MVLTRVVLGAAALLVALWLAANLRSVERESDALAQMGKAVKAGDPEAIERASNTFASARRFAPDAPSKLREAAILGGERPERTRRLLDEVLRAEPENEEAWIVLYATSKSRNDPVAKRARRAAVALDPRAARQIEFFESTRRAGARP